MESFCFTRTGERERENRGRKALRETKEEMAEHNRSKEEAHEAREWLLAEQGRGAQLGRPGKRLRLVRCRESGPRLGQ